MAETWAVEGDRAMSGGQQAENAAEREIFRGDDIAVKQNDRGAAAFFEIMEPNTVYCGKLSRRRVLAPDFPRLVCVPGSESRSSADGEDRPGWQPFRQHSSANLTEAGKFRAASRQSGA